MTEDQMIELEIAEIAEIALEHAKYSINGQLTPSIIAQYLDLTDWRIAEIREHIDTIKLESQRDDYLPDWEFMKL